MNTTKTLDDALDNIDRKRRRSLRFVQAVLMSAVLIALLFAVTPIVVASYADSRADSAAARGDTRDTLYWTRVAFAAREPKLATLETTLSLVGVGGTLGQPAIAIEKCPLVIQQVNSALMLGDAPGGLKAEMLLARARCEAQADDVTEALTDYTEANGEMPAQIVGRLPDERAAYYLLWANSEASLHHKTIALALLAHAKLLGPAITHRFIEGSLTSRRGPLSYVAQMARPGDY
jgi:hypothetical protein